MHKCEGFDKATMRTVSEYTTVCSSVHFEKMRAINVRRDKIRNPIGLIILFLSSLEDILINVNGKLAAFGEQVGVFVNLQNNKPIRIPESLKQKYREFLV